MNFKSIIRKSFKQINTNKFDNLDVLHKCHHIEITKTDRENFNFLKTNLGKIKNIHILIK